MVGKHHIQRLLAHSVLQKIDEALTEFLLGRVLWQRESEATVELMAQPRNYPLRAGEIRDLLVFQDGLDLRDYERNEMIRSFLRRKRVLWVTYGGSSSRWNRFSN